MTAADLDLYRACAGRQDAPTTQAREAWCIAGRRAGKSRLASVIAERRPPFDAEQTVKEFAATLHRYKVGIVTGDRYAGEWPAQAFARHGVTYVPSERSKSELYLEALPMFSSGRVKILDHLRLVAQFCGLERRTARSGRDSVDHGPGASQHDDLPTPRPARWSRRRTRPATTATCWRRTSPWSTAPGC
jgi:hypothetical protein